MPEFKERPKMDKPKTRPTTIPPKQAARILSEKYRKQLDQRPEESESETTDANDKVEGAGRQAVGEVTSHRPRSRQRQNPIKQKDSPATPRGKAASGAERPKTRPQNPLKTKEAQEQARPRQQSPSSPRQRVTPPARKETASRATSPAVPEQEVITPGGLTRPQEAGRQAFISKQRGTLHREPSSTVQEPPIQPHRPDAPGRGFGGTTAPQEVRRQAASSTRQGRPRGQLSASGENTPAKPPKAGQRSRLLKERPRTVFKSKANAPGKAPGPAPKVKPAAKATKAIKQTAQQHMKQQAVAKAKQAAKAAVNLGKKAAIAVAKAVASLVGSLVGFLGGGVLLVILIFIVAIAAIANSPFGIFFSGEGGTGGSSVPTVSVSEAVSSVNMEYSAKLSQLQSGSYDSITLAGQAAEWPDVLAVFASRYAAAEDGVDVATLDADRVSKLTATFWDMTEIETEVEEIYHSDGEGGGWTERILHITITPKTAENMKTAYSFTDFQISALDELLADRGALASLAGSLEITNPDVKNTLDALPMDLSADRKKAVETALQLVGKVNYFWGGKSYVIGWDSRWGQLSKVTADGSPSTGTYRPYGLDCSGFIDWTLRNAGLPSDGHWYVGTNLTEVTQANALPGDMALYPDDSHIGMVVGRDSSGKLLICHCSSGNNNVVVTEFTASGFTVLGRPSIYGP